MQLQILDSVSRTQLRLMESVGRHITSGEFQTGFLFSGLQHAMRHHAILSQRAAALSERFEDNKEDLSDEEQERFEIAILKLEVDACTEYIRTFALTELVRPDILTRTTRLAPPVLTDIRRVHKEVLSLITVDNLVELW